MVPVSPLTGPHSLWLVTELHWVKMFLQFNPGRLEWILNSQDELLDCLFVYLFFNGVPETRSLRRQRSAPFSETRTSILFWFGSQFGLTLYRNMDRCHFLGSENGWKCSFFYPHHLKCQMRLTWQSQILFLSITSVLATTKLNSCNGNMCLGFVRILCKLY